MTGPPNTTAVEEKSMIAGVRLGQYDYPGKNRTEFGMMYVPKVQSLLALRTTCVVDSRSIEL